MNLPSNVVKRRGELSKTPQDPETAPVVAEPIRQETTKTVPVWQRISALMVQLVFVAAIVFGGYKAMQYIVSSAPKAERKAPGRIARLVEVVPAAATTEGPVLEAWGDVRAARTLIVRPEVSGTLIWVHPEVTPGGTIDEGMVVARFDDRDLKLALARVDSDIADIEARILIEKGQAEIGRRELTRLSRNLTDEQRALILRKPQMAQLEAELEGARADRAQAVNALDRAVVKAPFNAIVTEESVAAGARLTAGTVAATLVAADRFHVALAVPAAALGWVRLDGEQVVKLTQPGIWPKDAQRVGRVVRLGSSLTDTGRMAELIVEVVDPMLSDGPDRPMLLLGSFLRGTLEGPPIEGAIALDRAHLRDGDTVWIMNADDKLEIRPVDVAWRGPTSVLVRDGLASGERIVTTNLATYAPGMALRVRGEVSG